MSLCGGCGNPVINGSCACPDVVVDLKAENSNLRAGIQHNKEIADQAMKDREAAIVERDKTLLRIRDYQAAIRKVDKCCNCLAYNEKFKALDRGTPEEKCEDCQHEKSYCDCIEKRGSGVSSGDQDTISRPGPQSLADKRKCVGCGHQPHERYCDAGNCACICIMK